MANRIEPEQLNLRPTLFAHVCLLKYMCQCAGEKIRAQLFKALLA